jgi:Zn-dependent protease
MANEKHRTLLNRILLASLSLQFGWLTVKFHISMAIPLIIFIWEWVASGFFIIAWAQIGSISLVVGIALGFHELLGHAAVFHEIVPGGKLEVVLTPILGVVKCNYKEIESPRNRFMLFAAGPAVNLTLALVFFFLNCFLVPSPHSISGIMVKLFFEQWVMVNVILGLFNALPLFINDGGRALGEILLLRGLSAKRAFVFVRRTFYVVGILLAFFFIYHRDFIGMAFLAAIFSMLITGVINEDNYFPKLEKASLPAGGKAVVKGEKESLRG